MLLQHLAKTARSVGIARFTAEVLAENRAMLTVFHNAGFPIESKTELGVAELTKTIAPELWETRLAKGTRSKAARVPSSPAETSRAATRREHGGVRVCRAPRCEGTTRKVSLLSDERDGGRSPY